MLFTLSRRLVPALAALLTACAAPAPSVQSGAPLVLVEAGQLPIVLSVPHGGDATVPGVPVRTSGTSVRDDHVLDLAAAVQRALIARTGRQAYLVAAQVSRQYVDFNREAGLAFQDPALQPVYTAYHHALARAVAQVRGRPGALLLDIHGQSAVKAALLRGTKDGLTARVAALYGTPGALLTRLEGNGVQVQPASAAGKEHPGFNGGYIVRAFGIQNPDGIDSIQLEFGADYRANATALAATASALADAIVTHLRTQGDR